MDNVTVVSEVHQLIELFNEWHSIRIKGLKRLCQAGDGTTIQTPDGPLRLTGETLTAFKTGLALCIDLFEESPLVDVTDLQNQGAYIH